MTQPIFTTAHIELLISFHDCHTAKFNQLSATKKNLFRDLANHGLMIESDIDGSKYIHSTDYGKDCVEMFRVKMTEFVGK